MSFEIKLNDAFKNFTDDQDKIMDPAQTVENFKKKIKSLNLNILEKSIRIDNGRLDIPVYLSICGADAKNICGTLKQMGKGATPEQAEASALMELAERFSFFSFYKNPNNFKTKKYKEVKEKAIPFSMIASSVHDDNSDELKITKEIFEDLDLSWTIGYNLTKNKEVLVPLNWFYMINEFNGPSAGNCVEEALSQGICEIVERHVSSIINNSKPKVFGINPNSAKQKLVVEMINKYKNAGINLYLTDFSLDTGIPTVGALAYDSSTFPETSEIVWTAGTTPDPEKALSRALTEVAQLAGDFNTKSNYVASGLKKPKNIDEVDYIINPEKHINISDLCNISNNNIKIEIENCISELSKKNMQVIVIETTHNRLQIPAFYTIIPGAHFRERALNTSVGMYSAKLISQSKNVDQQIKKLLSFEKKLPNKYYINFYLGLSFLSKNETKKALDYFTCALDLNPPKEDLVSVYSYMGVCLKEREQYKDAISILEKGKIVDNERTDLFNLTGFCYFKLKKYEQAIKNFEKVIELDPTSAIDYANIASNYRDMGNKDKAIDYYKLALEIDPALDFASKNLEKLR